MVFFGQFSDPGSGDEGALVANFDIASASIKPSLQASAHWRHFVSHVAEKGTWKLLGFSDCQGADRINSSLREQRAESVLATLPARIRARVVSAEAAPMHDCITENDTAADRTLNRSVAVVLVASEIDFSPETVEGRRYTHVCGPDVTSQLGKAVADTRSTFGGWTSRERTESCEALRSVSNGDCAWDIVELHNNAWILGYRPDCATQGATPPCGSTVQIDDQCYYAGSPNYVIFGTMCSLCHDHFQDIGNAGSMPGNTGYMDFTRQSMLELIDLYKSSSANVVTSKAWASAGYSGWPSAGTPPTGDRPNCGPVCPRPFTGPDFLVHWYPHMANEICGR